MPDPCHTITDPGCVQPADDPWDLPLPDASGLGTGALDGIADGMRKALRWFLENTMTW